MSKNNTIFLLVEAAVQVWQYKKGQNMLIKMS
jgi:hypothetical protein